MRIALGLEYCGHHYNGWQTQGHHDIPTVQTAVTKAVSSVANEPVDIVCAGRTDSGVHALGQVVHFDTVAQRPEHSWLLGINSNLPKDIAIKWVRLVDEEFHARFSAVKRRYHYHIYNHVTRPGVFHRRVTWHPHALDAERMHSAAQYLLGKQDFSSFRAAGCQANTPFRQMNEVVITRQGDFLRMDIEANAFLHHMVRNIVGVLFDIGEGKRPPEWMLDVLGAKDRRAAGVTAPANGLYLMGVTYPDVFDLPKKASVLPFAEV